MLFRSVCMGVCVSEGHEAAQKPPAGELWDLSRCGQASYPRPPRRTLTLALNPTLASPGSPFSPLSPFIPGRPWGRAQWVAAVRAGPAAPVPTQGLLGVPVPLRPKLPASQAGESHALAGGPQEEDSRETAAHSPPGPSSPWAWAAVHTRHET